MEPVLAVEELAIEIPTPAGTLSAVRDISFNVNQGEVFCLVGESGCGKSITSLAVMGLLPKKARRSARRMRLLGRDLLSATEREVNAMRGSLMSMVFQEPMTALNPCYTIGDQLVELHRRHRGSTRAEAAARAVYLLKKVGIAGAEQRLRQYPHQLSGGLRQRVMIAMALMCDPQLLIADEPTTALDVTVQAQILRLLASLQKELGISIVFVTHDLGVVAQIADRVAVMYAGEIVEQGPVSQVFNRPRHPYTQGLMRCIPTAEIRPGERLGVIPGSVPSLIDVGEGCSFRTRCAYASAICNGSIPTRIDGAHSWRCTLEESSRPQ